MPNKWIPYGRQHIDEDDIKAVSQALKSDWLTTGPEVEAFEKELAEYCNAKYAVVLNSGTAALHAAYFAAGLESGDEIITSPLTFAATANAALYLGAKVIFSDVQPDTGNLDPKIIKQKISAKTKVIVPIDYAGHPADLDEIIEIAHHHGAIVVEDACHALGATYKERPIGSIADMTVFSFHPVKHITTGEGGAVVTNNYKYAERIKMFRTHGIIRDKEHQKEVGPWFYEMNALGFNYRLPDICCALGRSQLKKLPSFVTKRRAIATKYTDLLNPVPTIITPSVKNYINPAWHLYVIRLKDKSKRRYIVETLHSKNIGAQIHYIPVYKHPYYQVNPTKWEGSCPIAEEFYESCISLPIYVDLGDSELEYVVKVLMELIDYSS